ncbi:MAG: hypothetical protein OXH50_11655 [Gemmatimonadetes bacterium]|nr:hypothetical protein [Gemmatimonadota bacterium]
MKRLYKVTGNAEYCAPCAWSALSGMSSDTWADKPMMDFEEHSALDVLRFKHGAPWYVDDLPEHLIGIFLEAFEEQGRWALTVESDGEHHAIAVACDGSNREIADNRFRDPLPLETVIEQHEEYRTAVIKSGFQLVEDEPLSG